MTVDQNAERNAIEERQRDQWLDRGLNRGNLECTLRLCCGRRGVSRDFALVMTWIATVILSFFVAGSFIRFGGRFCGRIFVVLLIEGLAENLTQLVLAQGLLLGSGLGCGHIRRHGSGGSSRRGAA